jgi:hypothetical protein
MYMKIQDFKEMHGHCQIPVHYKDEPTLGCWVRNQRSFERTGKLDETRFERLDVLGFVWDPCDSHWKEMYTKLKAYYDKHGHCQIPVSYPEDPSLGKWVRNQRMFETNGTLNDDRLERLNALELVWNPNQMRWSRMVNHLKEFTRLHGCVSVPGNYVTTDGAHLGLWVMRQKVTRNDTGKKNHLTPMRIAQLDAAGFIWASALEGQSNIMFNRPKQFSVHRSFKGDDDNGCHLGSSVALQSVQKRNTTDMLSLERNERLDSIGVSRAPIIDSCKKPRLQY